jgi:hypothetical protein
VVFTFLGQLPDVERALRPCVSVLDANDVEQSSSDLVLSPVVSDRQVFFAECFFFLGIEDRGPKELLGDRGAVVIDAGRESGLCRTSAQVRLHGAGKTELVCAFDFSTPNRILTCAHGSGVHSCPSP